MLASAPPAQLALKATQQQEQRVQQDQKDRSDPDLSVQKDLQAHVLSVLLAPETAATIAVLPKVAAAMPLIQPLSI